jgi:acetyltransferase-like isoleucine patch superfamily enzyme
MSANWAAQFAAGAPSWQPLFGVGPLAIIDVTGGSTTAVVTYSGAASFYRLDGGSPIALGASPATITGLTANTEYTIEISADGSTWTDPVDFGTLNPADGGGAYESEVTATLSLSAAIQIARSATAELGAAIVAGVTIGASIEAAVQASASATASVSAYISSSEDPGTIGSSAGRPAQVSATRSNLQTARRR